MSSFYELEFERPLAEIERRVEAAETALRRARAGVSTALVPGTPAPAATPDATDPDALERELADLRRTYEERLAGVYSRLGAWDTVRVARHPRRPQTRDYIEMICKDFCELHGDRRFGDDPAMVTGFARIGPFKCLLVGHHKGRTTQEKISCHFGCAHPEGYRKALAKMTLAAKFGLPIVTFVDTPGAYPGVGAEQRGQAEAIAVNLREMSRLRTPIVSVVIGEGGSGGALGIAVADRVAMLEHAWYSVISPEGCAAILWKEANERTNAAAADALRLTARENLRLGIIDDVIPEPVGGAHRDPRGTGQALERWIIGALTAQRELPLDTLLQRRYDRFRKLGTFLDSGATPGIEPEHALPVPANALTIEQPVRQPAL